MSEQLIRQLAEALVNRAPAGALAPPVLKALAKPTPHVLHDAATALVAGGHLDIAEPVFRALLERLNLRVEGAAGLARIAVKRGDPQAAFAAWRNCLNLSPGDAKPFWYVGFARAARQLGNHPSAEAALRKCAGRFPRYAPAAAELAMLLAALKKPEDAVQTWRTAIEDCSEQLQAWWIPEYAQALRAAGEDERRDPVLEGILKRFAHEPAVLAFNASRAASREDWAAALDLWTRCLDSQPDAPRPEWLTGRATALYRLWRAEEALGVWQDLITRNPGFIGGYTDMATAAADLGRWELADQCWSMLIARFPQRAGLEWNAQRAICLLHLRPDQSLDAAIAELDARFPASPLGRQLAIRLANRRNTGLRALTALVDDAVRRFPADRELWAQQVRVLLAHGKLDDAEAVVQRLEADAEDHHALISRWRLVADRDGEEAIIGPVERAVSRNSWSVSQALEISEFLLSVCSAWSMKRALALLSDLAERFPGRVAVAAARARTLVRLQEDQAALDLIESLPQLSQSQDVMELRAWARARRGDVEDARRIWQGIRGRYFFQAVHGAEPSLELVAGASHELQRGEVTAFVSVRDELAQLPELLRHHRRLGVDRFIVVDNLSTDGTEAYLRAQPDVVLYRTAANFQDAACGMRWINPLIERHGGGRWCLLVDADETFIYPGWEAAPLHRLIEFLDQEGAEAVSAFMLDVYPERLPGAAGARVTRADCRYYDGDYHWIGHVRPPYRRPLGGIRSRLFRAVEYLQKVPLIKSGRGTHIDNHDTTALRFASVTGALLHYKLLDLHVRRDKAPANQRGNRFRADGGLETMRRYERYAAYFAAGGGAELRVPELSQILTDSRSLADRELMHAPAEFRRWLADQDAGGRATSGWA